MATVTKRIAKSGSRTADGRELSKSTLIAVASSYAQDTYAARVNLEHYISPVPDSIFKEYGTVLALRTEDAPNKEVYLVADIEAADSLIAMWESGQKRAFSVEIVANFADTGKPYLYGLAVTSYPASLGTHFSAPPTCGKPEAIPTQYQFVERSVDDHAEFTVEPIAMPDQTQNENQITAETPTATPAPAAELPAIPEQFSSTLQHFSTELASLRTERDTLKATLETEKAAFSTQLAAKDTEIETLKQQIPAQGYTARPLATGNEGTGKVIF